VKRICAICQRKYVPCVEWKARLCGECRSDIPQRLIEVEEVRQIALDKLAATVDKAIIADLLRHLQRCNKEKRACEEARQES